MNGTYSSSVISFLFTCTCNTSIFNPWFCRNTSNVFIHFEGLAKLTLDKIIYNKCTWPEISKLQSLKTLKCGSACGAAIDPLPWRPPTPPARLSIAQQRESPRVSHTPTAVDVGTVGSTLMLVLTRTLVSTRLNIKEQFENDVDVVSADAWFLLQETLGECDKLHPADLSLGACTHAHSHTHTHTPLRHLPGTTHHQVSLEPHPPFH